MEGNASGERHANSYNQITLRPRLALLRIVNGGVWMRGHFALTSPPETVRRSFGYRETPDFPPRADIAPTQPIAIVAALPFTGARAALPAGALGLRAVASPGPRELAADRQRARGNRCGEADFRGGVPAPALPGSRRRVLCRRAQRRRSSSAAPTAPRSALAAALRDLSRPERQRDRQRLPHHRPPPAMLAPFGERAPAIVPQTPLSPPGSTRGDVAERRAGAAARGARATSATPVRRARNRPLAVFIDPNAMIRP